MKSNMQKRNKIINKYFHRTIQWWQHLRYFSIASHRSILTKALYKTKRCVLKTIVRVPSMLYWIYSSDHYEAVVIRHSVQKSRYSVRWS